MTTKSSYRSAFLICLMSTPLIAEEAKQAESAEIQIKVQADGIAPVEPGSTTLKSNDIANETPGSGDLNLLGRTIPGVQYSNELGSLTEDSILDLRPARISIGGARPDETNFMIAGLSTNSLRDTTNTNMDHYMEVVGHPQTTFVNKSLVDSITFHTYGVPAEFGRFKGGVVSVELRDPRQVLGGSLTYAHTDDNMVHFIADDQHRSDVMPQKEQFSKNTYEGAFDLPLSARTGLLVGLCREEAVLSSSQRHISYGTYDKTAHSWKDNVTLRLKHRINDLNTVRVTSITAPYEQEAFNQSLRKQHNDGWLNKLEWTVKGEKFELNSYAGFTWADGSREQDANLYTYRNFGGTDSVDWVAATTTNGMVGGFGVMNSTQLDVPVGTKLDWKLTETGTFSVGSNFTYSQARTQRPETNSAYRHQTSPSVINSLVRSGDGPDDPTVIEGEQALNYRIVYEAFDTRVQLRTADTWFQWKDSGKLWNMPWSYRAGLRYDHNDMMSNHDLAPRLKAQISPFKWLTLHGGFNRYYANAMLSYKLRENYPGTSIYTRKPRSENGYQVYYASDWTLSSYTATTRYGAAQLDTPYADELTGGLTLRNDLLGGLNVVYIDRDSKKDFARDAGTKLTYTNPATGKTATYTSYSMTNNGWTRHNEYQVEWKKKWSDHSVRLGYNHTLTRKTTEDYFDEYDPEAMAQLISHDGVLKTRGEIELIRSNYATPDTVLFSWTSRWFNRRLDVTLLGNWKDAYKRTEDTGTNVSIGGTAYDLYSDVQVPAILTNDLNLRWKAWERGRHSLSLEAKIGNLFDKLPHSESASSSYPYQIGRNAWLSATFSF